MLSVRALVDSRVVNKEIRSAIWPLLKHAGFEHFSPRTAWRHLPDQIDVLNFQSYNSYNAGVLGVTTYSFSVNLGCFLTYIPPQWPPKTKGDLPTPLESECQFRARLHRKIPQPGNPHADIWSISEDGRNLTESLAEVARQIKDVAFSWFEILRDRREVLRILQTEPGEMGKLWGFGRNPSPIRYYLLGYVAHSIGESQLARESLDAAVASGCFNSLFGDIDGALSRAP